MDFSYLLELAKGNDQTNKKEASVSRFSTKVSRPKKERPGPKVEAVKAVIDKIVVDKVKENEEARKKKENLLKLRAQDRKSNKRVRAMINMSKGASKSVLDDAKDITEAKGEEQCDEDDYGYESNMSQQIFSKLANTYASLPEDDKLKFVHTNKKGNIDDIKSRVMNTLKKVEEEENGPRKRKRRRHADAEEDDFINDGDSYAGTTKNSRVSSGHKYVNVNLTNYKSDKFSQFKYGHESSKDKQENSKEETKEKEKTKEKSREKDRRKEDRSKEDRSKEDRSKEDRRKEDKSKEDRSKEDIEKEKRKKKAREKAKARAAPPPMSFEELLRVAQKKHKEAPLLPPKEVLQRDKDKDKKKEPERPLTAKEKEEMEEVRRRKLRRMGKLPPERKVSEVETEAEKQRKGEKKPGKGENGSGGGGASKLKKALEAPMPPPPPPDRSKYFAVPFSQNQKPRDPPAPTRESRPPQSVRSQGPSRPEPPFREPNKPQRPAGAPPREPQYPRDTRPAPRGRPGPPRPQKRPPRPPSPPGKKRIESDDEEEEDYDSEMDDFIDDGEAGVDISSEIKRMFGYDRSKYQDEDDDCDDMEASYSQMQKEERISAKLGLKEDLEDIQREEEEKKLKMQRLKQAKKSRR